jgi:hypothetical protein
MKCIITEMILSGASINEAAIRIVYVNREPLPRVTHAVRYLST